MHNEILRAPGSFPSCASKHASAATRADCRCHGVGFIPLIPPSKSSLAAAAAGVPIFEFARVFAGTLLSKESNLNQADLLTNI
jgi:hypothetical protein